MNNSAIIEKILHSIQMAQVGKAYYEVIFESPVADEALHEFLFFIKPEITLPSKQINVEALLDLVFKKLSTYKLRVKDSRLLSASYLENFDIIAGHYGVINALSRDARRYLSHEARNKFRSLFGKDPDEAMVLGSIEFLQHHPGFTPVSLDELWLKNKAEKLAGGTYCMRIMVEGKEIYLVNGFHPRQLLHFTEKGRSIVAFTLTGELDWAIARNDFIGKTNPVEAAYGSLRNDILSHKEVFGLETVSPSRNGFHLSAGPVEGLVELMRYCSDYASGKVKTIDDFMFGRQLKTYFSEAQIELICNNHITEHMGNEIRVFDLTEEKNSTVALQLLKGSRLRPVV